MRIPILRVFMAIALTGFTPSFADQKPTECKQFVHYDKNNFSITLPTFQKVTLGSIGDKSDKIQAAADLTQLFDLIQFSNCQTLNRLSQQGNAAAYAEATQASLQSNSSLSQLAVQLAAYGKDPGQESKVAATAASSLTTATALQKASTDSKVKSVNLDKTKTQLSGELAELYGSMVAKPLPREQLWSLLGEQRKAAILDQLNKALGLLRSNAQLQFAEDDLAAFVMMPGGDGNLYFVPGLQAGAKLESPPDFSIPQGYGASGTAFVENNDEYVDIVNTMIKIGLDPDAVESRRKARMILLPEKAMRRVKTRYVAAFPISNNAGQPIAVMSISVYKILARPTDLQEVCSGLNFATIRTEIAKQLMFSP